MEESQTKSLETLETTALDVEFLPLVLLHKIHRNRKSSQVEIVPVPYYVREPTPEPEPEMEGEMEMEQPPPTVVFAPPLPAFKERKNWWDFVKPVYSFNNPRIRARVELLMNARIVHVTDRKYMVRLQEKIRDDHLANLRRRMQNRAVSTTASSPNGIPNRFLRIHQSERDTPRSAAEDNRHAEEIEREKSLLLGGKISLEEAPAELKNHPVCRINQTAKRILSRKKAKSKPMNKTTAYKTSLRRIKVAERALRKATFHGDSEKVDSSQMVQSVCVVNAKVSEDVAKGLMFSKEGYDKLKHEDPLIKLLREIDAVNDMYELADKLVGSLKVDTRK